MKNTRQIVRIILICLLAFFLLRSLYSLKEGFVDDHLRLGPQSEVNKYGTITKDAGNPSGTLVTDGNPSALCSSIPNLGKWCKKWSNGLAKEVTNPETIACAGNICKPSIDGQLCCKK
jgi:hypothetical protein